MGSKILCVGCYCCLFGLKPTTIEMFAEFANIVEIAFSSWAFADIPWSDISTGGIVCFYISWGLMLMTLILLIILMILRVNKTINTSRNDTAKFLCITDCIFDFIAFIMTIISEGIILHKMNELDHDRNYWSGRREYRSNGYFTNKEWAAAIISTSALIFLSRIFFDEK